MIPKNITKDHLLSAINDIRKDPELRKGRASSTYDAVYNNELYPPKLIVSLSNKYANNEELNCNDFKGGTGTECFKLLERNGIKIVLKKGVKDLNLLKDKLLYMNKERYNLKEKFLKKWSRERMKKLTLEEYANDTKDSFIYDMEFGLSNGLGGMGGGSAFKFGIYRMKDTKKDKKSGQIWDGKYAWYEKYGKTRDKAFLHVKQNIISLIDAVDNDNLELIDDIDFGDNYKWKIAFLYSDFKVLNIFKRESFNDILSILDINEEHKSYSRSNRLIVEKLEGDYFNYTSRLWKFYEMNEVIRLIKNNNTVNKFFKAVNYLCNEFDLDNENDNIYASALINKKRLHFTVGSRYIIRVGLKNKKSIIGFHILKSYRNEIFSKYNSEIVSEEKSGDKDYIWVDINADGLNIPDVFPFLRKLTDNNLEGQSKSQFRSMYANKHNDWIVETAINKDLQIKILGEITEKIIEKKSSMNENNALNKVLYGPPGTGKTYKLSHEYFDKYTDKESKRSREELLDELLTTNKYSWFEIIAAIIKENGKSSINEILSHELVRSRVRIQNPKTARNTIWAELLEHGHLDSENIKRNPEGRREPMIIWKDDDSKFDFNNMDVDELILDSIELLNHTKNLLENNNDPVKRYEFVTFHQAFSYEDFIEGIKPVMDEETDELKYEIKPGVFKEICNRAKNDPENRYALFIDEINRGNVANIFGELITLIEPDKREGMDNALSVKLPYSKTIFSVPNNLDIIGTMNTADRSVEALDTALRRRFEFEEMLPNSSLLSNIRCEDIDFVRLLNTINSRIEKLLDKDHQIGHSYFMNSNNTLSLADLRGIFKNKIMPLLQEYFYGDFGKIGLVLGDSFIKENKNKSNFSKFNYDDRDLIDERKVYQLSDITELEATDFISIYEESE